MLQVYIYEYKRYGLIPVKTGNEGFLDISPGTVLNIESVDEIFDEDFSFGEFSLPVDIPWTERNRRLLGFSERLQNFAVTNIFYTCDVFDRGFAEITGGKFTILERSGQIDYRRGSFSCSISGSKGVFGTAIKGKKLANLELGGYIGWTGTNSRGFATDVMKGLYPQYPHLRFAPVAIENFIDTTRKDYTTEFLAKDTVNYVVVTGGGVDDWVFGKPSIADETIPAGAGTPEHMDYRTVPFFQIKFLFRKCFEEFGFTINGDFLASTDFDDAFLYNNCSIENYVDVIFADFNSYINPQRHVPDIPVTDFIIAVCKVFNMFVKFLPENKCELLYRKTVFADKRVMPINDIVGRSFKALPLNTSYDSGYTIKYGSDDTDEYISDMVKKPDGKTLVATVQFSADLTAIPVGGLTTDSIALVTSENIFYVVADATGPTPVWEVFSENMDEAKYGDGTQSIELPLSPLLQYAEKDPVTSLRVLRPWVGCRQKGTYNTYKKTTAVSPFGLRMFYIKKLDIGGVVRPASFNHDTDASGNQLVPYSMALNTGNSIDKGLHRDWLLMAQRGESVTIPIRMDRKIDNDMKLAGRFELQNVMLLRKGGEKTIPMSTVMDMEFITI